MSFDFTGRGILLDVEGTTSAVAYVYDVMFPYARRGIDAFVAAHWDDPPMEPVRAQFAADADGKEFDSPEALCEEAHRLMDADAKTTGLKQLQGLVWEEGFHNGDLEAHVFTDVPPALCGWHEEQIDLRVYSSGSVHAQKLFFGHSVAGDLRPCFSAHYDTTTGPKRDPASYTKIAECWGFEPEQILFLSDVTEELDAARKAGMATALVVRPGNAEPTPTDPPHPTIESFDEVVIRRDA